MNLPIHWLQDKEIIIVSYLSLYRRLGFSDLAVSTAFGENELPFYFIEQSPEPYGVLPALIPIWREDIDFIGFWKHWFTNKRHVSIVQQSPEREYEVEEIARSFEQLLIITFFRKFSAFDHVDEKIEKQATDFGIPNIKNLFEIYCSKGDDPHNLIHLDEFKDEVPLYCEPKIYKGDFPNSSMTLTREKLRHTCTVEFPEETRKTLSTLEIAPEWFKVKNQEPLFYKLLDEMDFLGAWMSLNSNGWRFKNAKKAIRDLSKKVNDKDFEVLAETWSNQPHERYVSY